MKFLEIVWQNRTLRPWLSNTWPKTVTPQVPHLKAQCCLGELRMQILQELRILLSCCSFGGLQSVNLKPFCFFMLLLLCHLVMKDWYDQWVKFLEIVWQNRTLRPWLSNTWPKTVTPQVPHLKAQCCLGELRMQIPQELRILLSCCSFGGLQSVNLKPFCFFMVLLAWLNSYDQLHATVWDVFHVPGYVDAIAQAIPWELPSFLSHLRSSDIQWRLTYLRCHHWRAL